MSISIHIEADDQGKISKALIKTGGRVLTFEQAYLRDALYEHIYNGNLKHNLAFDDFPSQQIMASMPPKPIKYQLSILLQCSTIHVEQEPT